MSVIYLSNGVPKKHRQAPHLPIAARLLAAAWMVTADTVLLFPRASSVALRASPMRQATPRQRACILAAARSIT